MVKHLEKENDFKELTKGKILLDFYADWCGPCKMLAPVLEQVDFIDVLKINVDEFPELSAKFGVMSIPTLVLMENSKEIKREIGFKNLADIKKMVE